MSPQHPLRLNKYTEPQPDLAVLKLRADYYGSKTPASEDALFVLEVSDTTLRYDTKVKLPLYAAAGVPEVWIANLSDNVLLVSRDLSGKNYTTQLTIGRGGSVSPLAFPDDVFQVEDIIG